MNVIDTLKTTGTPLAYMADFNTLAKDEETAETRYKRNIKLHWTTHLSLLRSIINTLHADISTIIAAKSCPQMAGMEEIFITRGYTLPNRKPFYRTYLVKVAPLYKWIGIDKVWTFNEGDKTPTNVEYYGETTMLDFGKHYTASVLFDYIRKNAVDFTDDMNDLIIKNEGDKYPYFVGGLRELKSLSE